jgi:hypothetical protein
MLPLPLRFIIAMMAHAINERMARKLDYLLEDVDCALRALPALWGRRPPRSSSSLLSLLDFVHAGSGTPGGVHRSDRSEAHSLH